jgi:FtsP/CotA-like multicopper oxidase with cupredoxin domain
VRKLFLILQLVFASPALAKTYDLEVKKHDVFITGKAVEAITVNGQIPAPTLYWEEGEDVVVNVKNSLKEKTSIHWHGILLPGFMDGVPGLNGFHGIAPGETFTYKFKIRQAGTYWYHSHSNIQEQQGLYGAIVITPKNKEDVKMSGSGSPYLGGSSRRVSATMGVDKDYTPYLGGSSRRVSATMGVDKDYTIVLSDFTEENPNTILNNLKIDSGYYNYNKRTISTFFSDIKKNGFAASVRNYLDWNQMRMDPTDLADVTNYRFLVNGKTPEQNWSAIFKKGERIKLRFINASAMTIYDVSIPGLKMKLVEADGQPVKPVIIDEFRFGVAETYDVIVEPKEDKAYTIFAESIDRTGYARATLAPFDGMEGKIPAMRPRAVLTMADMKMDGMDHSGMDHSAMNHDMTGMDKMRSGWADRGTPKGHKALEYTDLVSLLPQKDLRQPTKEIEFRFGGSMNRYIWTIDGQKFPEPTKVKYGERIRLKFTNDTMMAHPVHLHGMFMQMENYIPPSSRNLQTSSANATTSPLNRWEEVSLRERLKWLPNKHTVIVPPAQTVSLLLTADEEGEWAFHCHLLYHMLNGMMTSVTVEKGGRNE